MNAIERKEAEDWMNEAEKTEEWNDSAKFRLFQKAKALMPVLWHEIEVLKAQLELRKK